MGIKLFQIITGIGLLFGSLFQSYAQDDSRLKRESWFWKGKVFKEIHYDSLSRRVLYWEQKKKIPLHSSDEITKTDYDSVSRIWKARTLFGRVNKKGEIIFPDRSTRVGLDFISQYDTVANRTWSRFEWLNRVNSNERVIPIQEAWNSKFIASGAQDFNSKCYELMDSTELIKRTRTYYDDYYLSRHRLKESISTEQYDPNTKLLKIKTDSSFTDKKLNAVSITTFKGPMKSTTTHWLIGTKESYARTDVLVKNDTLWRSTHFQRKIDNKDFKRPFKVDYTIDFEYPHPTLERQIITKEKKKFLIEIRKQFY